VMFFHLFSRGTSLSFKVCYIFPLISSAFIKTLLKRNRTD
jgi:hypothetical protein